MYRERANKKAGYREGPRGNGMARVGDRQEYISCLSIGPRKGRGRRDEVPRNLLSDGSDDVA